MANIFTNQFNYNFGKATVLRVEGEEGSQTFVTRAPLDGKRPEKDFFDKFVDWINAPGNGQNVYKLFKQSIDLVQEVSEQAANTESLSRLGSLFGRLREGAAPLYWLSCTREFFHPSEEREIVSLSTAKAGLDWLTATFLNISIFAPVFERATKWTGPAMTFTDLGANVIELGKEVQGLTKAGNEGEVPASKPPFKVLKVLGLVCGVAISVFGVVGIFAPGAVAAVPVLAVLVIAVSGTAMKLVGSFMQRFHDQPVMA